MGRYLITSHGDNTLTLYLVRSTASNLTIDAGQRLYGHTSGVSSVLVDSRGKAVSINRNGSEMRVWELEGGVSERRSFNASVRVDQSGGSSGDVGLLGGFDDEKVVVLLRTGIGSSGAEVTNTPSSQSKRALVVYDFTR